jgi:hypothetical protein
MADCIVEMLVGVGELTLIMGISAIVVWFGYLVKQSFTNKQ